MNALVDHLWQCTWFGIAAAAITFALRRNSARVRYCVWLAASAKFLLPFSLLVGAGARLDLGQRPNQVSPAILEQVTTSFMPASAATSPVPDPRTPWRPILTVIWAAGAGLVAVTWALGWKRVRTALRNASPIDLPTQIPVLATMSDLEPGIVGFFRPVLVLPHGITARLTAEELDAIFAHEFCHARWRDNLASAFHMIIQCVFWFHPLVWWIGSRLIEERERACDEAVLLAGKRAELYAQGILRVCRLYVESPVACASGVTGASLTKRIHAILTHRRSLKLSSSRKFILAASAVLAVAVPVFVGFMNARTSLAQTQPDSLAFDVATIKPSDPNTRNVGMRITPGGGVNLTNMTVKHIIAFAYGIPCGKGCDMFISGGPSWMNSQNYDIVAKASTEEGSPAGDVGRSSPESRAKLQNDVRLRLRSLLADRFRLELRRETRELPVYALLAAKDGPNLKEALGEGPGGLRGERGRIVAERVPLEWFVANLAGQLGRPVIDRTGLNGRYDFTLDYTPEQGAPAMRGPDGPNGKAEPLNSPEPIGPSLFTALQEQLGLKLDSTKGPVDIIVVDRVEKPTEN